MKKTIFNFKIYLFILLPYVLFGQTYTLKQCVEYAAINNSNIKMSEYDKIVAEKKVSEQIGSGLPQIDASGNYTDNLKIATTLLPGEIIGAPGTMVPVKMGVPYTVTGSLVLKQKIYDPLFWVGLKATKISRDFSEQNIRRTNEQTSYTVSRAYLQAMIIKKQLNTLNATREFSEKALASTELKYQNGMAKRIDVDKLKVNFNNIVSAVQQTELSYKQILNNLKYLMGMPIENNLVLSEAESAIDMDAYEQIQGRGDFIQNRSDYQLLKTNVTIQEANKELYISQYLPTLSFNASYNYQAMRQEFDFFKSGRDWFPSSTIGLSLSIPIFDGLQKVFRVSQADLNVQKAEENLKMSVEAMKVEVSNYEIQYRNALDNIKNEHENLNLAESVYKNTQLDFNEGRASSLELIQSESSYTEAQNNYYNKLLSLYLARLDIEQSKGTITNFINNLK
jgi:outer membrane protein